MLRLCLHDRRARDCHHSRFQLRVSPCIARVRAFRGHRCATGRCENSKLLVFQERSTQERVLLRMHGHQHAGDRSGQRCSTGGEERGESLSLFFSFGVLGSALVLDDFAYRCADKSRDMSHTDADR